MDLLFGFTWLIIAYVESFQSAFCSSFSVLGFLLFIVPPHPASSFEFTTSIQLSNSTDHDIHWDYASSPSICIIHLLSNVKIIPSSHNAFMLLVMLAKQCMRAFHIC